MDNQEAIKILGQYDVSDLHFYTTDGEEIPFAEWSDAIETAISALEKQIPRKPIEPESFSLFYKCPICKKSVNDHARYCAVCGCKLNWSEGEG